MWNEQGTISTEEWETACESQPARVVELAHLSLRHCTVLYLVFAFRKTGGYDPQRPPPLWSGSGHGEPYTGPAGLGGYSSAAVAEAAAQHAGTELPPQPSHAPFLSRNSEHILKEDDIQIL